jgi:hypothetical protein
MTAPGEGRARRRGVVRTAVVFGLIAVGFYVGFILITATGH